MKKMIPVLITTHLLCVLLGFCLGAILTKLERIPEPAMPTEIGTETTVEIENIEAAEQTVPTENTTVVTEAVEVTTEATEAVEEITEATETADIPVYVPSVTNPPATQSPVTEPSATQPPAPEPSATQPPAPEQPATQPAPDLGDGGLPIL